MPNEPLKHAIWAASPVTDDEGHVGLLAAATPALLLVSPLPYAALAVATWWWIFSVRSSGFVNIHAREALNLCVTFTLITSASWVIQHVAAAFGFGFPAVLIEAMATIFYFWSFVRAVVAAWRHEHHRYRFSLHIIADRGVETV